MTVHMETPTEASRLYERVARVIPPMEWPAFAADIDAIAELKKRRDAVILAHNYQTPEIFHCVADFVGDSLALARQATKVDARMIVMAGVHFMAETAKLLNPGKTVLIPDLRAGCSLAESITAEDVRALRRRFPGVPVVTYVNTSAAVKAESDICCTSGNARRVIESLGAPRVVMLPDKYLAANVARQTRVEIIPWDGRCEVHERFTPPTCASCARAIPASSCSSIPNVRPRWSTKRTSPARPRRCRPTSTSASRAQVALLTECSMSDNVAVLHPEVDFVRPCNLCPHMKRITLANIRRALEENRHEVTIDPAIAGRARRAVERMIAL